MCVTTKHKHKTQNTKKTTHLRQALDEESESRAPRDGRVAARAAQRAHGRVAQIAVVPSSQPGAAHIQLRER